MKTKSTFTFAVIVAIAVVAAVIVFRGTTQVKAQDQIPPPVTDRISFPSVGISSGQTLRVSAANTIMPNDPDFPPGPSLVLITFRYQNGNLVRDLKTGAVIRKTVDLERGDGTFVDLDYDGLPPGPSRAQIRPVVVVIPPPIPDVDQKGVPPDGTVVSVEVINRKRPVTNGDV